MKKLIILFTAVMLSMSCSTNEDNGNDFTSDLVVDGIEFKPNRGTYGYSPANLAGHTEMWFSIVKANGQDVDQSLTMNIMFPTGSTGPEGEFDFGPGTAEDFLVSAGFSADGKGYSIVGYSMNVTKLGGNEFLFEFNSPVALEFTGGFAEKPMSGSVRAKLNFQD